MRRAIAVAGMPGAGKGVLSRIAQEQGFRVYSLGDVVRDEAAKRGLDINRLNLRNIMFELRREGGPVAVARKMLEKVDIKSVPLLLVEGVRSLEEVAELRRHRSFVLVAVHASPGARFERIKRRGRPDDPQSLHEFDKRDLEELKVGQGDVIALADIMLVNEESLEEFEAEARKVVGGVMNYEG
ncbi:MAG: AAA family ATPase [Candidatus Bathyarchaeia archaeon]